MLSNRIHRFARAGCGSRPRGVTRSGLRAAALAIGLLLTGPVLSHEPYTAFMTPFGQPCCGGKDCAPLAEGDVSVVRGGFYIGSRQEFVPKIDAQPGPDTRYHICTFKGLRMCFLIPPGPGA